MKRILITLLICAGIFSCSKDKDDTSNGSGKNAYKASTVVTINEPVMYTNNGEVHDPAIIKDYVTRRNVLSYYVFDKSTADASMFSTYTLEFQGDKNTLIGNMKAEIIDKNDSLILMAVLDSSISEIKQKSWSDSIMDKVNKNGPLAECATYYTDPCPYRKKYPLLIVDGQYYIPYVVATASTNAFVPTVFGVSVDYTYFTHQAGESMIFNKSMTSTLGGTVTGKSGELNYIADRYDTLVVQTMRRIMVKQ
jgi:hypothetical protein